MSTRLWRGACERRRKSPHRFQVRVLDGRLDVGLCVFSGQVFRWNEEGPGVWSGWNGATWYQVRQGPADIFDIKSNQPASAFESYFRLEWDAASIEAEILRAGPELSPHMSELRGLRLLRPACAVEAFYSFLCTPNNHLKRITGMVAYLAKRTEVGFPSSEQIAALPEAELRRAGFGYRAATIPEAARQVVARGGDAYLEGLRAATYDEARAQLISIKGIGPKLADCICLFGLDHTEAVPVDTHVWQAATRLFFPQWRGLSLTGSRYHMVGDAMRDRFGKSAGWAQQYLFYENLLNWRNRPS